MEVTAEVRVWWPGSSGQALVGWFEGLGDIRPGGPAPSGSAEPRQDLYLCHPNMGELGIKIRSAESESAEAEFKTLIKSGPEEQGFGPMTCWVKASARGVLPDPARTIAVAKLRSLRRFAWREGALAELPLDQKERSLTGSEPSVGCDVELTLVRIEGSEGAWHTVCFEAFGGLELVESVVRKCIQQVASHSLPPGLDQAEPASFTEFIRKVAYGRSR